MTQVNLNEPTLPARHPADRDHDRSPSSSNPSPGADTTAAANGESRLKKIRSWTLGGIHLWSFMRLFVLLGLIAGTAGAWWYTIKHFQDSMSANQPAPSNQDQGSQGNGVSTYGWSSTIFVHVAFSIVVLFELVFLERNVFQLRAERYMFNHGMSPDARRDARRAATLGIAPWNRPPLPTYAAALAESGHGTGDVEDNLSTHLPILIPRARGTDARSRCSRDRAAPRVRAHARERAAALVDAPQRPRAQPQPRVAADRAAAYTGGRHGGGPAESPPQLRRVRGGRQRRPRAPARGCFGAARKHAPGPPADRRCVVRSLSTPFAFGSPPATLSILSVLSVLSSYSFCMFVAAAAELSGTVLNVALFSLASVYPFTIGT